MGLLSGSSARHETPPRPFCHFPARIQSLSLRKSADWHWLGLVLPRGLYSPFMTPLGQLVPQREAASPCAYKAFKSEVTISFPNIPGNTITGARNVDTFSLLVHLHTEKQCPAQNTIHDPSQHLYQLTVMSQIQDRQAVPAELGSVVPCTTAPTIYHRKLSVKLIHNVSFKTRTITVRKIILASV